MVRWQPVLYNTTTGARYIGNINVAGKVRFALPGSGAPCEVSAFIRGCFQHQNVPALYTKEFY